ncbi:MAG TPA: SurA N-terminal domain-containing protein [Elusimicrobiota bacterium]|nr:SurA N-terminal domain-containing protein [Elusimicrobiota bacterium]
MMKWLRKHRYTIFLITTAGFVIGAFMGFGSYFFSTSPYDAALTVNGKKISYKTYQTRFHQYLSQQRDENVILTEERTKQIKQQAIQDLVREEVFIQQAERYGLAVTDNELAAYIQNSAAFRRDNKFDQRAYFQVIHQVLRTTPEEFEKERRRDILIQKLQTLLASTIKVTDVELSWQQQKIAALSKDPEERKMAMEKPNELRNKMRQEQINHVFQEWLTQLNNQLKVQVFIDKWERRGEGA